MEKRSAWSLACRVLLGVLCTVGFFYQANSVMQTYLDHPYQSVMTAEKRRSLVFPSVTICTGSWINKNSSGCRENPRLCSKYQQEIVIGVYRAQYEPALRWKISHAPHELFECRMRSTTPMCGSFDCRKHIRITYLRLPIQLCYTLDSTRYGAPETELGKCDTPWLYELEAKMIVDPAQTLRLMHTVPFPVFVQPPGHCVPERVAPVALEPNQIYHIAVKQQVKYRLPAPYPSDCKDYLDGGPRDAFYGFPSKESCTQECIMQEEMNHCACVLTDHEYSVTFAGPLCSIIEGAKCWDTVFENKILEKCMDRCKAACKDITYDSRVTSIQNVQKLNGSNEQTYGIVLKFATDDLEHLTEQPTLNAIEIFGYIGGYLGMWLGFSLLELLEHYRSRPRKLLCLTVNATEEKPTSFEHTQRVPHVKARRRVAVSGKSRSSLLTSAGIPDNRLKRLDLWAKSVIADEPLATD